MTRRKIIFTGLTLLMLVGLSACGFSLAQDITPPPGAQMPIVAEPELLEGVFPAADPDPVSGAQIFLQRCAPCHGETGLGDGPQSGDLPVKVAAIGTAEFANQSTPQRWYSIITQGKLSSFMPPFSGVLDEQSRWDVMAYVYSLGTTPDQIGQGDEVYQASCAECHGVEGRGDGPEADNAADLTDQETMIGISGNDIFDLITNGAGDAHPAFGDLSEEDRLALTAFVRSLTFAAVTPEELDAELLAEPPDEEAQPGSTEETADTGDIPGEETTAEDTTGGEETSAVVSFTGVVTNGSGEGMPDDLLLTLYGYDHFDLVVEQEGKVDLDGSFSFEGLPYAADRLFFVAVDYQGATYGSDFVTLTPDQRDYELAVTFYDSTNDPSALRASRLHIFFDFSSPEAVQVLQLWIIANPGEEAVVPVSDSEPALFFDLPDGFANLVFEEGAIGQRFVSTSTGFGDTLSVLPGETNYQLLFAFELPYDRSLEFVQNLRFPVDIVQVFLPSDSVRLEGEGLQPLGAQEFNGVAFDGFTLNGFQSGETLNLSLKGRNPAAGVGFSLSSDASSLWIGLIGLAVAVFAVVTWLRREEADRYDVDEYEGDSPESVMDEIIALDEAYEAGEINEKQYEKERAALKAILAKSLEED